MNGLTEHVRDALHGAGAVAGEFIGTEHLLLALARSPGVASTVLARAGLTVARLEAVMPPGAGGQAGTMPFSPAAKRAIELAVEEAVAHRDEDIGTAHLLLSLLSDERENAASMAVAQAGFDRTRVRQAVHETLASGASDSD